MKPKKTPFFSYIVTHPYAFSILEMLILIIGISAGTFFYIMLDKIRTDSINASSFDRDTSEILFSISLANSNFNSLMDGSQSINIEDDVFVPIDTALSLCSNVDNGGPSGKFMPAEPFPNKGSSTPSSVCSLISDYKESTEKRWDYYQKKESDILEAAHKSSFLLILQSLQRFANVADPHIEEANIMTKRANLEMGASLIFVFLMILFVVWRTRRIMAKQTKQLETQIDVSTRLNFELESDRNFLNTLLDTLPEAVFAKNCDNRFIIANPAAAQVMGRENKEELLGKNESNFQPSEISEKILLNDQKILSIGETRLNEEEALFDHRSEAIRWRQTTRVPLRDRYGQITGLVGISRDITKQKETEETLHKTNEQLIAGISALEQTSRETEHLSEMIDLLQACPSTEEACIVIADQLAKFFPEDSGVLYLYHASRNILDKASSWGPEIPDPMMFKPYDCWGLRRGRMHVVETINLNSSSSEAAISLICPHVIPQGPADYLCVPLVAQGEALGLLHMRHNEKFSGVDQIQGDCEWFTHSKKQRIHTIVDSLSLALANLKLRATLKQQSIRDPLTGLFNRRYLEETLDREILRASRNNECVGLIMLDIDHFKQFNDTFGHQAGDVLLKSLGRFFMSHIRGEDVACRFGGEEFILLLPGSSIEKTAQRAEEIRDKVHAMNVTYQEQSLGSITLSSGVAIFPNHGTTPEILVQKADQALYQAKTEGRDRVIIASSEL